MGIVQGRDNSKKIASRLAEGLRALNGMRKLWKG